MQGMQLGRVWLDVRGQAEHMAARFAAFVGCAKVKGVGAGQDTGVCQRLFHGNAWYAPLDGPISCILLQCRTGMLLGLPAAGYHLRLSCCVLGLLSVLQLLLVCLSLHWP
jgi:hypothetical protein